MKDMEFSPTSLTQNWYYRVLTFRDMWFKCPSISISFFTSSNFNSLSRNFKYTKREKKIWSVVAMITESFYMIMKQSCTQTSRLFQRNFQINLFNRNVDLSITNDKATRWIWSGCTVLLGCYSAGLSLQNQPFEMSN